MSGNNRKLIVTGVSSFIGFHLATFLSDSGYKVIGTISKDLKEYDSLRSQRLEVAQAAGLELKKVDITDTDAVSNLIETERPELWINHGGWASNYGKLDYDLDKGHQINVASLEKIYSLLRKNDCHGVILTGSSAEYSDTDLACREDFACWPTTPYGLSKLSETIRARQLAYQYGIRTRVARVFIPYGYMDTPSKLIPSVISSLRSGNSIDLSPCLQSRDFINVRDLVRGYEALIEDIERDELFDIFNLCSGEATTLKTLLLEIAEKLEVDTSLLQFGSRSMRPGEAPISYGSNAKALKLLDWKPNSLQDSIQAYLSQVS